IGDICISMSAKDYLQLPDLVEDIVPVALDSKAAKAYEEFEKNLLVEIDDELLDAGSAAVLSGKLLQMANGAVYNEDKQPVE
ncbi:ATP-dependent helicase, partial [Anaerovorax odorimutans]|nr:ATP-dependent helicase [Anaerovorax odorimutans]